MPTKENSVIVSARDDKFIRLLNENARRKPQRIVFTEGDHYRILKAAEILIANGVAKPILARVDVEDGINH
jgi:malate dehydrogenase (oxaloacetate-decarboxylating)(NADP+)